MELESNDEWWHHRQNRFTGKWEDTHAVVHACGVGQHQPMDTLIGADEDDDIVERFLDADSPG